jgi:signal transduction histidine kinase
MRSSNEALMTSNSGHDRDGFPAFDDWSGNDQIDGPIETMSPSGWTSPEVSDAQRWQRVVDALSVIAALIREHRPSDTMFSSLAAGAAAGVHADAAVLRVADLEANTLEARAVHGFDRSFKQSVLGTTCSIFDAQHALASSRSSSLEITDTVPSGFTTSEIMTMRRRGITRVLVVPLLKHGTLIGRLDLLVAGDTQFIPEERTVAEAIGAIIASAIADADGLDDEPFSRLATIRLSPPTFDGISDAREMFQYLVQWIDETLDTRQCYGLTWHQKKEAFSPVAVSGSHPVAVQALKQIQLRPEHIRALREAINSESPYVIPDARDTSLFPPRMARLLDLHNVMILPLRGGAGQIVGTILLDFPLERKMDSAMLSIAAQAGNYAAIMLENALLYEAVQRSSENLRIVNEIGMELASLSDLDSLFKLVYFHLRSVIETTCFVVGLILPDRKQVEYRFAVGNQITGEPVTRPLGNDVPSTVITTGRPQATSDPEAIRRSDWFPMAEQEHVIRSAIAVPIQVGRETIGVLSALSESQEAYPGDTLELITTVGVQLGAAIQNARLYAIVRARGERRGYLLDQIIHEQESERKMLVDNIHNHTLQTLAHSLFQLDIASLRTGEQSVDEAKEAIDTVRDTLADNIDRLREIVFRLRPSTLEILGLESAIRDYLKNFERDTGIETDLEFNVRERQSDEIETRVYRFVQEAVDSIRHRNEVTRIMLRVTQRPADMLVTIADDGIGVDKAVIDDGGEHLTPQAGGAESRLLRLRERAELAGGRLEVTRRPRGGSIVQVVIPYQGSAS